MEPQNSALPENLLKLRDSLSDHGIEDLQICTWLGRHMLRGRVEIKIGKYAGSMQQVGWSFGDDAQPYPEYAPHWFHVAGDFDDGKGGAVENEHDENGQLWTARSRPIGASWKGEFRIPSKLMRSTVTRFWKDAK